MRSLIAAAAILVASISPVAAAWMSKTDTDPLTDQVIAFMAGSDGGISIGAKCWKGEPDKTLIMVTLDTPWDASADYKSIVAIKMRTDAGEIREVLFTPSDMGGRFGLMTSQEVQSDVLGVIREWETASRRIVIGLESSTHQIGTRGSTKAVQSFLKNCEL